MVSVGFLRMTYGAYWVIEVVFIGRSVWVFVIREQGYKKFVAETEGKAASPPLWPKQ